MPSLRPIYRFFPIFALTFGFMSCKQPVPNQSGSSTKAYGENHDPAEDLRPFTVKLARDFDNGSPGPDRCNAAIVGERELVFTAHCYLYGVDSESGQLKVADKHHYLAKTDTQSMKITNVYLHPKFLETYGLYLYMLHKDSYFQNAQEQWTFYRKLYTLRMQAAAFDVAIASLENPLDFTAGSVKIPGKSESIKDPFFVAGYNWIVDEKISFGQSRQSRIHRGNYSAEGYRYFAAFDLDGTVCSGDSGGPAGRRRLGSAPGEASFDLYALMEGGGLCGPDENTKMPNFFHDLRGSGSWLHCMLAKHGRDASVFKHFGSADPYCGKPEITQISTTMINRFLGELKLTEKALATPYNRLHCNESSLKTALKGSGGRSSLSEWCSPSEQIAQIDLICPKEPLERCIDALAKQDQSVCLNQFEGMQTCFTSL